MGCVSSKDAVHPGGGPANQDPDEPSLRDDLRALGDAAKGAAGRAVDRTERKVEHAAASAADAASDKADQARDAAGKARKEASSAAGKAAEQARDTASRAKSAAGEAADEAQAAAAAGRSAAQDAAESAQEAARDAAQDAKEAAEDMVPEHDDQSAAEREVALAAEVGPTSVIMLMRGKDGDLDVVTACAEALGSLCTGDAEHRRAVMDHDGAGLSVLLKAMRTSQWHPPLQSHGMKVMQALAADHSQQLGAAGAVDAIVQSMQTCEDNYQVQLQGVKALALLVRERDNAIRAKDCGADAVLETTLENNAEDGQISFKGRGALQTISSVTLEELHNADFLEKGSLWGSVQRAVSDGRAREVAAGNIPGQGGISGQVAEKLQEGANALIRFMIERRQSAEAQLWCCDALASLCAGNAENRLAVFEANGHRVIIGSMRKFHWEEGLQTAACMALTALSSEYSRQIGEADGVNAVVDGMRACNTDYQVQFRGVAALRSLCKEEKNVGIARAAGAVEVVKAGLERNPDDSQLQWHGIQLLQVIDTTQEAAKEIEAKTVERAKSYQSMRIESFRQRQLTTKEKLAEGQKALDQVMEEAVLVDDESGGGGEAAHELGASAEEAQAALRIQAIQRGRQARAEVDGLRAQREQAEAAAKIQAIQRGRQARAEVDGLRAKRDQAEAAAKIQAIQRGRQARAEVDGLRAQREQAEAAARIQAIQRGRQARAEVDGLRAQREQAEAAARIQAIQRGRQARAEVSAMREQLDAM